MIQSNTFHFVELENPITCEEILSEKICHELREAAKKLKIDVAKVDALIREALEKGKRKASEIIAYIRGKLIDLSKITCADVISQSVSD